MDDLSPEQHVGRLRVLSAEQKRRPLAADELREVAAHFRALGRDEQAAQAEAKATALAAAPPSAAAPSPQRFANVWYHTEAGTGCVFGIVGPNLFCLRLPASQAHRVAESIADGQALSSFDGHSIRIVPVRAVSRIEVPDGGSSLDVRYDGGRREGRLRFVPGVASARARIGRELAVATGRRFAELRRDGSIGGALSDPVLAALTGAFLAWVFHQGAVRQAAGYELDFSRRVRFGNVLFEGISNSLGVRGWAVAGYAVVAACVIWAAWRLIRRPHLSVFEFSLVEEWEARMLLGPR